MIEESLRNIHLFRGCSQKEIEKYMKSFGGVVRNLSRGEVIVREGAGAKWMIVVLSGTLELYDVKSNKKRVLVRVFEPGGFLGMSLAMTKEEYYPCVINAGTDTDVLVLDAAKIHCHWYKPGFRKFYENLFECFSDYVRFSRDKLSILHLRDAEDRIMLYLRQRAALLDTDEFSVPFRNSQMMADYLGITRTSLSRSIAKLEREGKIVHWGKGLFSVVL